MEGAFPPGDGPGNRSEVPSCRPTFSPPAARWASELTLRGIAFAVLVATLGFAAGLAATHEPSGVVPSERGTVIEDWHGNSASIRVLP